MSHFRFIHCADLHLGCTPARIEERFYDFFLSFSHLVDYAIEHKASYIVISGDFFHLKVINPKTLSETVKILDRIKQAEIKVFVIEGNHDKAFYVDEESWLVHLHNRGYIFLLSHSIVEGKIELNPYKESGAIYEDENVRIIGVGYLGASTEKYLKDIKKMIKKKDKFTILMLHAAINRLCGQDMGDVTKDLIDCFKKNVDYIALGHIHNRYEYDDFCYNPGALENIRLHDAYRKGVKGFYVVEVEDMKKQVTYVPHACRPIFLEKLLISEMNTPIDVENYICNQSYDIPSGSMMELSLYGILPFNAYLLDTNQIKEKFIEKYHLLYIEINNFINMMNQPNEIEDKIDAHQLEQDILLKNIQYEYPEIIDAKKVSSNILRLKELILENAEDEILVQELMKMEDIL